MKEARLALPHDIEPIDVVYTWVDGAWPGYDELLRRYATNRHDLNPNRYRDNLDLLKYSLRSLDRHAPWVRNVILVTCRPQEPAWLDTGAVRLVHHDEFMPAAHLPTFSSQAILSHLHEIEGLSRRFLYMEDDQLLGAPVGPGDLFDPAGRPLVWTRLKPTMAPRRRGDERISPWNRGVALSRLLLDKRYGRKLRWRINHLALPIEVASWRAMIETWPEAFQRTSANRFRATGNVTPEFLYAQYLLEEGRGVRVPLARAWRWAAYHPLNNLPFVQRALLARLRWQAPKFSCLNDNFGERPHPAVVRLVRRFLQELYPEPSRFERRHPSGTALNVGLEEPYASRV